jgi:hypothetical protein
MMTLIHQSHDLQMTLLWPQSVSRMIPVPQAALKLSLTLLQAEHSSPEDETKINCFEAFI